MGQRSKSQAPSGKPSASSRTKPLSFLQISTSHCLGPGNPPKMPVPREVHTCPLPARHNWGGTPIHGWQSITSHTLSQGSSSCCNGRKLRNQETNTSRIAFRMPSTAASWAEACRPLLQGQRYPATHRCVLLPTPALPQVCMNTCCYTCEHTVPGMHIYRLDLTCILRLQVEKPDKGQPLHLSWRQNIIPEERE